MVEEGLGTLTITPLIEALIALRHEHGELEVMTEHPQGWMQEAELIVTPGHYSSYDNSIYPLPCGHMMCSEIDMLVIS